MRGRAKSLSSWRRLNADLLRYRTKTPAIPIRRVMHISPLIAARRSTARKLPWTSIFAKAFAITAQDFPPLRQVYVRYPWPHLYEYEKSAANIAIAQTFEGELIPFGLIVKDPAALALDDIAARIDRAARMPVESIEGFRRQIRFARLPWIVRRPAVWLVMNLARVRGRFLGSFALSTTTAFGAELLHTLCPLGPVLNYGTIADDGKIPVWITFDHLVMDGATVALALARMEEVLNGPILREVAAGRSDGSAQAAFNTLPQS